MVWDSLPQRVDIIGNYFLEAELQILKFLAVIGYRDLLICRHILSTPTTRRQPNTSGKGFNKTEHKPSTLLLPRIKYTHDSTDKKFSPSFADPSQIEEYISKVKPHLRRCHSRHLPDGMCKSESAMALAAEYEYILPEGYTFVSPAYIGGDKDAMEQVREEFKSISLLGAIM